MSDDTALPDGWTEADMNSYLTRHAESGTFAGDEQVATMDVGEISEEGTVA